MSNLEPVKFGTDGWRAVIADTYTFVNVKRIAYCVGKYFGNHAKIKNGIIVGYDTRFMSKEFAEATAETLANLGIRVILSNTFVTTPTVSLLAREKNLALGVMITASHNPYKYNGFKLKDEFGGSMNPEIIKEVEKLLPEVKNVENQESFETFVNEGKIELFDAKNFYLDNISGKIDISSIKKSGVKVLYEAMYGAGQGSLKKLIGADELHGEVNPSFGGGAPEPVRKNLDEACAVLAKGGYDIGIVNDGDADRIAVIDENGNFIDAQKTFALLLVYLHKYKKMTGKVVRGYSTSDLIKKYCEKNNLELLTVPIGFKHISKLMINDDIMIGAEESGGIGIKGHLPERDGVFNGLLFLEMLANTKKKISELKQELEDEFGKFFYNRIDKHTTDELKNSTLEACSKFKPGDKLGNKIIKDIGNLDGYKFTFDNGWIIVRASGTEPLLRFYCETTGVDETLQILKSTIEHFKL